MTPHGIFGVLGTAFSIVLFFSPMTTFVTIVRKKEVGQFSPAPFLAALLSCMGGVIYGLPSVHPNSILVLITNGVGIIVEMIWIIIFYIYATRRLRIAILRILAFEMVLVGAVLAGVFGGARSHEKRTKIVGIICVTLNTLMYGSPLSIMGTVIQTRSVRYMPVFVPLASLVSTACWLIYSLLRFDLYILISNILGAFLSASQVILFVVVYYCITPRGGPHAAA